MNVPEVKRQWLDELLNQEPHLPVQHVEWLNQARAAAKHRAQSLDLPHRKQEAWRYTSIDRLVKHHFVHADESNDAITDADLGDWVLPANSAYRLVFANGYCIPRLCNVQGLSRDVTVGSLRASLATDGDLIQQYLAEHAVLETDDLFASLNAAHIDDGLYIHIAKNVALDKPIEVLHLNYASHSERLIQPRHLVVMESGAQATLVERFSSLSGTAYFTNNVSNIFVNDNANLTHYRIQDESTQAHHLSRINLLQGADSTYHAAHFTLGANWSRCDIDARFSGKGAHCDLSGLYTVNSKQLADIHLNVQHNHAHCTSRENFRGIVAGSGRAVFDGRIVVDPHAQKTDAQLTNKNLLLSRDAEVDTKPQLEIYADDVKCSHGTTVGQIDPRQVFYLRSRGIPEDAAKKMLCLGFAGEILEDIKLEGIRSYIENRLQQTLFEQ